MFSRKLTEEEVSIIYDIEAFVRELDPHIPVEYLDFNPLAGHKYRKLGKSFNIKG